MGLITIELIDDYRSEYGSVFNSHIDEDVYYDAYGFPYFPAWVIRNSLRTIAEGLLKADEIEEIFGDLENKGSLILEHALIGSRESMRYAIVSSDDPKMKNQQQVLKQFTDISRYFRNGKEITYRILKHGLIFEQCFRLDEKYKTAFEKIVSVCEKLDYGIGRIHCEVDWNRYEDFIYGPGNRQAVLPEVLPEENESDAEDCRFRMDFHLKLLSPLCVFEPLDESHETKNYIPGELILKAMDLKASYMDKTRVSFAFCEINGKRSQPVSSSFAVLKTDKKQLRDRLSDGRRPDDFNQLNRLSNIYVDDNMAEHVISSSVETEYGKIILTKQKQLCSYHAISPEQIFYGFLEGDANFINQIINRVKEDPYLKLGEFSEIGFGLCRMELDQPENIVSEAGITQAQELRVDVLSPIALCQYNGIYTDSADRFLNEMQLLFEADDLQIVSDCKEAEMIQGYSKEWTDQKPLMYLTKGGSVFRLKRKNGGMIRIKKETDFVGDFTQYGFGEIRIRPMENLYYRTIENIRFDRNSEQIRRPYDQKPGVYLIRRMQMYRASSITLALGRNDAAAFYDSYYKNAREIIKDILNYDVDEKVILNHYLKGIKEVCEYILSKK